MATSETVTPEQADPVIIIGAGISGLCMGIALLARGIRDFLIIDRSPAVGGTWFENHYPGACCDVPSLLYSFSFAPNPAWSRRHAPHDEIRDYLEGTAERFGLLPHLRLGEAVTEARCGDDGRWRVQLASGEMLTARAVVSGLGQLNVPSIPAFPGRERFDGPQFHSARWDHRVDLAGKRVAVIGTAASALQFIPHVARDAAQLYVYQRSPNYVLPRGDRPYRRWERSLFRRLPLLPKLGRLAFWLRGEWVLYPVLRSRSRVMRRLLEHMSRRYLEKEIPDPDLRRKLTPAYRIGCKRILFSDDYYSAYRRDSVELVTAPIAGVDEDGVITEDGISRPVDVIIYGTGFKTHPMLSQVRFRGPDGRTLQEAWADGVEAYRGVCTTGFPNLFMLYGPNTNLGSNSIIFMVERQCRYVAACLDKLLVHGLSHLAVNREVQRAYSARMQGELAGTVWGGDCGNWYRDASGRISNNWPRSTTAYAWHMRAPDFADFDLRA